MKKLTNWHWISFFWMLILFSCNRSPMHTFVLYAPSLNPDSLVFITGNHEQLGNWNPNKIKMEYIGDHSWQFKFQLTEPQALEYKYTLGSWAFEGASKLGYPLSNFTVTINNPTKIHDTVLYWTNISQPQFKGQITGEVRYHKNISGLGLLNRDIIVWLPPKYDSCATIGYPVLYMLDGQNIIDPATSIFGNDWQIDETCDSLIKNDSMNPLIVVGIYNTEQRSIEYLPGDTAQLFMKLVVETIKPLIDQHYHTLPDCAHTFSGGSSAGATMAFMLAWEYNNVFSKAICMSPAFKIQEIDLVSRVNNYTETKKKLKLYIDNGGWGIDTLLQPGINEMLQALQQKGYKFGYDLHWVSDTTGHHSEKDWAKRFPGAIQFINNK